MITPFTHERAATLEDALAAIAAGAVPYAGGTELLATMKLGLLSPTRLVDIKSVSQLRGVRTEGASLVIGAATPHAEVAADGAVLERLPMLAQVERGVGNPRVRWQGTIGGNLCFAEPRSDIVPALLALGAIVRLRSVAGSRTLPLEAFIQGAFTVDRRDDELMVEVEVPTQGLQFQAYERIRLLERPTAGVALVRRDGHWRLAIGAAGYQSVLQEAADLSELDPDAVVDQVDPIEDSAGSADYKRAIVRLLVRRSLDRANGSGDGLGSRS